MGLLCFWIPVMEVLEFCSRVKGLCPASSTTQGQRWQGHGSAPPACLGMGSGETVLCPSLQSFSSIPGCIGEPRRPQWSCSQLGLQPQVPSRAAFGRGLWAKPRAPYTVNQAVQVGSKPKPERKRKKWVSFWESSLAPAETEGPMILHHFAFSLPPLT